MYIMYILYYVLYIMYILYYVHIHKYFLHGVFRSRPSVSAILSVTGGLGTDLQRMPEPPIKSGLEAGPGSWQISPPLIPSV